MNLFHCHSQMHGETTCIASFLGQFWEQMETFLETAPADFRKDDLDTAEKAVNEAITAGVVDVLTCSTVIKRHVQRGDPRRADAAIKTLTDVDWSLTPNAITFNELIDAQQRGS